MLLRLLKRVPGPPRARLTASLLLTFGVFAACGGEQFSAGPVDSHDPGSAGAGAVAGESVNLAGDSGGGNDSNAGGSEDMAGAGGVVASAGSAGKGAGGCANCDASKGMYCQDGTSKCRSCKDFSRLEFAVPQLLSAVSHTTTSSERFPRPAASGSSLFYTEDADVRRELWYAAAPTSGFGNPIFKMPSLGQDSGPLLAPNFVTDGDFFFDRADAAATGVRKIMMGSWSGSTLTGVAVAPAPLNVDNSSDYSIAVAPDVGHAYWMSTRRTGSPELFWESINETSMQAPGPLSLTIRIGSNDGCDRLGDDATPWVNLDGTVLLFSAESMADTCEQNDSHAHDLFAVPLSDAGQPLVAAVPLSALNVTGGGSDETDPSLSPDACSIYFASDSGTGNYDLYRAARN